MTMNKKILVVDDEPDVVTYLTAFLRQNGFQVISAGNGKEGFERARSEQPDLITLDITMPGESGVRMFRDLQEEPAMASIPVFIVTGISPDFKRFIETRKHVKPPAAYFEKPVDLDELLSRIQATLGAGSEA